MFYQNPDKKHYCSKHHNCNYPHLMKTTIQLIDGVGFGVNFNFLFHHQIYTCIEYMKFRAEKQNRFLPGTLKVVPAKNI